MLARSYGRRLDADLSRSTINRWVAAAGAAAMTPLEMSRRLAPPDWGGWIGIDGKQLRIGHHDTASLMIAVDQTTTDLIHTKVVPHESGEVFAEMLIDVVRIGYPLAGVVADFGSGAPHISFLQGRDDYFPDLAFQACRVHLARRCDELLSTPPGHPDAAKNRELKTHIRNILFAPSYKTACNAYWDLTRHDTDYTSSAAQQILSHLRRRFGLYMTHHRHPGLPASANTTENVVRTLNRRIHPMEHFATTETAEHYTRLLAANYRWKPFTDSTNARNGQSPLQLAGVTLPTNHWLTYLQQQHST
ncbi:MAG: hypothetical protein KJN63_04395 [Acidimicrobiia bacterium]|nr:hypothetical protein [Acidimicrobiia bacterium]